MTVKKTAQKIFDFFVFSSLYIALCAIIMVIQTNQLLHLTYNYFLYILFVFFSTIASYNFHWYLTPHASGENYRTAWTQNHRNLHLVLFFSGLIASIIFFFIFFSHWFWMSVPVLLTFLYSAPKLPYKPFGLLTKVAIGKTLYLSFVWVYVTTILPIILGNWQWTAEAYIFTTNRFFLIYAICILFDYRDRENDRREGIKSMITFFGERSIKVLFYSSLVINILTANALFYFHFSIPVIFALCIPAIILLFMYPYAKSNFSDYFYYFVLDGLMMISSVFTILLRI